MLHSEFTKAEEPASRWLMVVLHGLGDSAAGYHWMPGALRLPWLNYQLVNAPDQYCGGYSWFDFDGDMRPGINRSRAELNLVLDRLRDQGFPTEQTFLFGFSQGCLMVLETGLRYPRRFAGIIGVSGLLPDYESLIRGLSPVATQQRLLVTHGSQDPLLPLKSVKPQMLALCEAGLDLTWKEYPKAHTIHGDQEIDLIRSFIEAGRRKSE